MALIIPKKYTRKLLYKSVIVKWWIEPILLSAILKKTMAVHTVQFNMPKSREKILLILLKTRCFECILT